MKAVARVSPSSPHGYCLHCLEMNFMKANARIRKALREQCWAVIIKITYVYISKEFEDVVCELASTSGDAHTWLLHKSNIDCHATTSGPQDATAAMMTR